MSESAEFRYFLHRLELCDGAEYRDIIARLYALAGIQGSDLYDIADGDREFRDGSTLEERAAVFDAAGAAVRQVLSPSIHRDVARRDLSQLLDEAIRPVLTRLGEPAAPEAFLWLREIDLALRGQRKFGQTARHWVVMAGKLDGDEWLHSKASSEARELQRQTREGFRAVRTVEDEALGNPKGVIFLGHPIGKAAFLAGRLFAKSVPMAVVAREPISDLDLTVLPDTEAAHSHLRALVLDGDDPLAGIDIDALRDGLIKVEASQILKQMDQSQDRMAARELEFLALAKEKGFEKEFFEIYANGSRMHGGPRAAGRINAMRHRIEALEAENRALTTAANGMEP